MDQAQALRFLADKTVVPRMRTNLASPEVTLSNIGPNFRPSWQQTQPNNPRSTEAAAPVEIPGAVTPQAGGAVNHHAEPVPSANLAGLLAAGLGQELALGQGQLLQLLRSLLQMPKELAQLMAMLADTDPSMAQQMLKTLLEAEVPVPLEQLQNLLLSHANAAQDKLLKLMQGSALNAAGHPSQLGEVLSTLGELVNQAKQSPGQALHATINLYLPYPLHLPQAFSLRYESPGGNGEGEGEGGAQQGEQLALYIETMTLGQFKITLAAEGPAPLKAIVIHEPVAAPFAREITQQAANAMGGAGRIDLVFVLQAGAKASAIQSLAELALAELEDAGESSSASAGEGASSVGKQSVGLHPSGGLCMAALYGAYVLIRVIFELDEQHKLHQQRASM